MKKLKQRIPVVALFFLLGGSLRAQEAPPPSKPNVIVILVDDMGYGDIDPFGCTQCKTPALNRMASEGLKLTSFYAAPVCSASRAQILTGSYAPHVSIPGVLAPNSKVGLNPAEHTIAKLLKAQGYTTSCIGKWHLGDQPDFLPMNHGFNHYFGLPYSNDMARVNTDTNEKVIPLIRDNKIIEFMKDEDQDRLNRIYTEEAVKFIQSNKDHPFFLYLAHSAVHTPIHPGPEFKGHSGHGRYYDWVEETDWSVGQILDTLRSLKLDSNTLVIFTSDNGPWLSKGEDAGSSGPLRGGKGSTWEGGLREPTIAWWPGRIPAGKVSDAVTGEIDLLPTFVTLAGGAVPQDRLIDGADMTELLLGKTDRSPREAHFYYQGYKLQAIRSGPWKLALGPQEYSMGFKENEKQYGERTPGLRLYNLETDIGETTSVAEAHPDEVKKLMELADKQKLTLGDGPKGTGVRPPGEVKDPQPLYPMTTLPEKKGKKESPSVE